MTDRTAPKTTKPEVAKVADDERWMAELPDDLGCLGLTGRDPGHALHKHEMDLGPADHAGPKHHHRDVGI